MSEEANKAIVRRFREEVWNQGQVEVVDELCSPDYVHHFLVSGILTHRDGLKRMVADIQHPTPVLRFTIEDLIAEGDRVVELWSAQRVDGAAGVICGLDYYRLAQGKIVEKRADWEHLVLLSQGAAAQPRQSAQTTGTPEEADMLE